MSSGLVALALGIAFAGAPAAAPRHPELLARVEGQAIPAALFRMHLAAGVEALGLDAASDADRRQLEALERGIVSELIDRALLEAEARRRGIAVSAAEVEARLRQLVAQSGGEAEWRAQLAEHGVSEADFRHSVEQELLGPRLRAELERDVSVSAEEVRGFYEKERANPAPAALLVEPEQVEAAHVLIEARPHVVESRLREAGLSGGALAAAVAEEMARRRQRAEGLRRRLLAGEDFAALAREHSDDRASRTVGGELGRFSRGAHAAAFDAAAFALAPGEVGLVQTEYGFHAVRVERHTPQRLRSLEEARPQIEAFLGARKRAERLAAWLGARRRAAAIRIEPGFAARVALPNP